MSAFARFLLDASEPPTWTGLARKRSWFARVVSPALDTPVWLALLVGVSVAFVVVLAIIDDLSKGSYLHLAFVLVVLVPIMIMYARRVVVILRHRQ